MRMQINAGELDAKSFDTVKTNTGTAALNTLMSQILDLYSLNETSKQTKAAVDTLKTSITELMKATDVKKINHKGINCTLVEKQNKNIDTDKLLDFCKTLEVEGLVKTVEVVDMDVLENMIYTGKLEQDTITPFITITESVYPKLSGKLKE